jgi:hypothetical protein
MQDLLDQEEKLEMDREQKLLNVSDKAEKKRLEKNFGIERAKASERIKNLAKKHKNSEQAFAEKLGL